MHKTDLTEQNQQEEDGGNLTHPLDRPTQLICIFDIYVRQQTNTKDIAGQFARGGESRGIYFKSHFMKSLRMEV